MLAPMWWLLSCVSAPAPVAAPAEDLRAHMQGHRADLLRIRDALVRGDLDAAKQANAAFLEHRVAFDLPGDWAPRVTAMGEAAVALREAGDLPAAAAAATALASACGDCHRAVGVSPAHPDPAPPSDAHGARQGAALDRLFASLWTPSVSWEVGVEALASASVDPMVAGHAPFTGPVDDAAAAPAHDAAAARVLASCAACHVPGPGGVFPAGRAPTFRIAGGKATAALVLGPREGSPSAAVQELVLAAGAEVPPHVHAGSDELLVVRSGRVEVVIDGRTLSAGADDVIQIPRDVEHSARVIEDSRVWQVYVGPGPERRFAAGAPVDR